MPPPRLSLLVPTRGEPERLTRFLTSLQATAVEPEAIEVVLCYDAGAERLQPYPEGLQIVESECPAGSPMGALNRAAYTASSGLFVMLANDDIQVRTEGWDIHLLRAMAHFPDGISLIHVNDGVFGNRMCVFPMMSRLCAEILGEICPADYQRFGIDDHITDIFKRLTSLGQTRHLYLDEVVFFHENEAYQGVDDQGQLRVTLDPLIANQDAAVFTSLEKSRQKMAERLLAFIQQQVSAQQ